jgi:osmotically-inducible protein OsmY
MRSVVWLLLFTFLFSAVVAVAQVSDDAIYDDVRRRLAVDPDIKGGALVVDVKAGVVTVSGLVDTTKAQAKIEKVAKKAKGVKEVINKTTVRTA